MREELMLKSKFVYINIISIIAIFLLTQGVFAATPVSVVKPEIKAINNVRKINSRIIPYQDIQVSSKIGGIIDIVNVQVGEYVKKGQPLFQFEQDDIEIQIKQAEAALKIAQANFKMLEDGATSEDRASAEAAYQQAVASYEGARNNLELIKSSYTDRTAQKQQFSAAETQLKSAEKQVQLAEEGLGQAITGLEQAENEYKRMKYLYEENVVTKNQYEMVENQYKNARSAVESARLAREQASIAYQGAEENSILAEKNYNNPTQLEQQLAGAETQLKVAEANMKMAKANLDKLEKGAREEELITVQASVEQAEAALEQVKKALSDTIVKSPIDGIVAQFNLDSGEMVGPGTPAVNIVNLDKVYIEAGVTEELVRNLEKGQNVSGRLLSYDNMYLNGIVDYISPVVDPRTQAYTVKVLVEDTAEVLRGGMFVELDIPVDMVKEALVIPVTAVINLENKPFVYLVKDDKAVKTPIEIGIISGDSVEIIKGIEEEDKLVFRGQYSINDDDSLVEVIN